MTWWDLNRFVVGCMLSRDPFLSMTQNISECIPRTSAAFGVYREDCVRNRCLGWVLPPPPST